MEIERAKKLLKSGVEAGNKVKAVRELIKTYKNQKQDQYDDTAEILAPTINAQMKVKETIDEKQDEIIEQLQKNQKALTAGIADIVEANQRAIMFDRELPQLPAPATEEAMIEAPEEKKQITSLDIDNNFNKDDRIIIDNYKLLKPKDLTQVTPDRLMEERNMTIKIAKKLGGLKRRKFTTEYDIESYNRELQTMKKYRETINDIMRSLKYRPQTGQGIRWFNNPKDLLSRLELLGGSISAGNTSNKVKDEFANIVLKLNKLKVINMRQINDLMKEYLI